jgi:hypothetical protein
MFTTIMYGFINEVTRQPGMASRSLEKTLGATGKRTATRPVRPATKAPRRDRPLPGTYRVLADSFRRAAGFI